MEKHDELIEALGALTHDPLAFVYFAYPWGEPGTPLEDMEGPDEWQIQILKVFFTKISEKALAM